MGTAEKTIFDFSECPHCGNAEQYYLKVTYKGRGVENSRFDNEAADNTHLYDGITVSSESKYYYCEECHKAICKVHRDDISRKMAATSPLSPLFQKSNSNLPL